MAKRAKDLPDIKYDPDFCFQLIEHCRKGESFQGFAGVLGCAISTLDYWANNYPMFSEAKKRAEALALLYRERQGDMLIQGKIPNGSVVAWIYLMKARFRHYGYGDDTPGAMELRTQRFTLKYNLNDDVK